jgi:V/A-type H+/Na+-transporting ATPase subunit K
MNSRVFPKGENMNGLIAMMVLPVAATLGAGIWLELKPRRLPARLAQGRHARQPGAVRPGAGRRHAAGGAGGAGGGAGGDRAMEITMGQGLALLGIGLPTGLAAIGAAIALGPIGSASLAVIAEKPEMFGRTLIYMGLAEGIAIYGLVMSILLLGKI